MKTRLMIVLGLAFGLAACDNSVKLKASADDGETFTGNAIGTGFWDVSGTLQLVGNRGTTCLGTFAFDGVAVAGPKGKAVYNCSTGATGEAVLEKASKSGEGNIGSRKISFSW